MTEDAQDEGGLSRRDTPTAGRPASDDDPGVPPLGPRHGDARRDAAATSGGPAIAGQRGASRPAAEGGRAGELERENRGEMHRARRDDEGAA